MTLAQFIEKLMEHDLDAEVSDYMVQIGNVRLMTVEVSVEAAALKGTNDAE